MSTTRTGSIRAELPAQADRSTPGARPGAGQSQPGARTQLRMHVDWVACDGRGLCLELLPEVLAEDPWGYPMAVAPDGTPPSRGIAVPAAVARDAERAVAACPKLALRLSRD